MKRDWKGYKKPALIASAILLALVAIVPFLLHVRKAQRILEAGKQRLQQQQTIAIRAINIPIATDSQSRLLSAAAEIRDAIEFEGDIYAASSAGILRFSPQGKQLRQWTTTDGLPSQDLTAIARMNDSLWIGTRDSGLLKLRGEKMEQQLPDQKELRAVTSLLSTKQGILFIGTRAGILRYDGHTFQPFYPEQLGKAVITKIEGDSHQLWIGTFNQGLYAYQNGSIQHFDETSGLQDLLITDIQATSKGVWISTPSGIQRVDGGQVRKIAENSFVSSFVIDKSTLWTSSVDHGVARLALEPALNRRPPLPQQSPANSVVLRKIDGTVLAFGAGANWYLDRNDRWQPWGENESRLSDSNISAILRARNGEIWIGYFDHGIDVLSAQLQKTKHIQDDTFFCINYLAQDAAGTIYVSTANGLAILGQDGSRRIYHEADGLLSDRVMQALPLDPDGKRVAIATAQGFTLKEGESMKSLYAFQGLVNNHIYTIAARGDEMYLGTLGGISSLRKMQVESSWTQMDSGLRRNWVNALLTLDHKLLIGTYGSGIQVRTDTGDWTTFRELPQDFEVNPNAFFFDGRYVFCGTLDRGFYVYDTRRNAWKQVRNGLPSPNVTAFAADPPFLYVATNQGLLQISYDKINTLPDLR